MYQQFENADAVPPQSKEASMIQPQGNDDPGKIQMKTIETPEDFEAVLDGLVGLGYDPGKQQTNAETAGRRLEMEKLFTRCSRPENHQSIRVLMKGNDVLGSAVVKTEPNAREAEVTDIRLASNTRQQNVIEDFLRTLKDDLRTGETVYVRARVKMPEGHPIRSFIDAKQHHWVENFYIFETIEDPSKPAKKTVHEKSRKC